MVRTRHPRTARDRRRTRRVRADGGGPAGPDDHGDDAGDDPDHTTGPRSPDIDATTRDAADHAAAVAAALAGYDRVVEVGIGRRTDVAARLAARGVDVLAVDVQSVETPEGVAFVREDVTEPDLERYRGADALYALNLPPDLQGAVADLAREVGADLAFTTLGGDPATVPTRPETLPCGTLHWLSGRDDPGDGGGTDRR